MSKLETKEAVEILLSEKKKAEANLAKAYDSYCLLPNEHDKEDWDNYSALVTALEMAVETLEKQIPKKPGYTKLMYKCNGKDIEINHPECPYCRTHGLSLWDAAIPVGDKYCKRCGQAICWEVDEPDIPMEYYESGGK